MNKKKLRKKLRTEHKKNIKLIEKANYMNVFVCMCLRYVYDLWIFVCASAVYADMEFSLKRMVIWQLNELKRKI